MTSLSDKFRYAARMAVCVPFNLLQNLVDPPMVVLLYHRVTTLQSDPEMLAVSPDNFRAQMRYLKETFPVVRFEENWAEVRKPAVVITFDDGYADNALEALPILEEVGIPATFFVSTGTIGTMREFWWHELERIILAGRSLPADFTLDDAGRRKRWPTASDSERQEFYREMVRLMTNAGSGDRERWLSQLRLWAGIGEEDAGRHRAMSADELHLLATNGWATIGAHTVTHARLSALAPADQQEEITASKRHLESLLGRGISVFSYPFGTKSDYTEETVALCRKAGFTKAAANFPGKVHRWTDPLRIPRHLVRNWPVGIFAQKLKRFWRS